MAKRGTREQILEAGLKTLLEKGYNGSGVQDIVALAGVPKGSFYNYFDSKEALGAEIVESYGKRSERRQILKDVSIPPLDRLRRHFEGLSAFYIEQGYGRGCLLGSFSAELANQSPLICERLAVLYADWTRDLAAAIQDAQAEEAIATRVSADVLAGFVLDAYEGALLRARVERSPAAFERFMTVIFGPVIH